MWQCYRPKFPKQYKENIKPRFAQEKNKNILWMHFQTQHRYFSQQFIGLIQQLNNN